MNYEGQPHRFIAKSKLGWFIGISVVLHALLLLALAYEFKHDGSSHGIATTFLLETTDSDHPSPSQADATQISSKSSQGKNLKQSTSSNLTSKADDAEDATPPSPSQSDSHNQIVGAPQNTGTLVDQSSKSMTPADAYKAKVTQHLLNKIGNLRQIEGEAVIKLTIQSYGIATQVSVNAIKGSAQFEQWLSQAVLNANPMPAFSSAELGTSISLTIPIKVEREQ